MAAPRLSSTLMLRYRISLKESAHALGRSQQELQLEPLAAAVGQAARWRR